MASCGVTCFDETGKEIRQACWYPDGMSGSGSGMAGGANK
jgi:hypothetical protein